MDFSTKIIHLFKFGDIKNSTIHTDGVGCRVFQANGFNLSCNKNQKIYDVIGVDILWRVGEYYLQNTKNPIKKIIIQPEHIYALNLYDRRI
ncbi:MAG: hypothetical protein H0U73_14395 [Tatlockia sp.]|nr:hypothetical protein [Tatlockia sp.]